MSDETKRWECQKCNSEEERLALEIRNARRVSFGLDKLDDDQWRRHTDEARADIAALAKARALLEPAAHARGVQEGRREALTDTIGLLEVYENQYGGWNHMKRALTERRDACGPAKSPAAPDIHDDATARLVGQIATLTEEREACRAEWLKTHQLLEGQRNEAWREREELSSEVKRLGSRVMDLAHENATLKAERDDLSAKLAEAEAWKASAMESFEDLGKLHDAMGEFGGRLCQSVALEAIRILREQKAEIARLTGELEGARKVDEASLSSEYQDELARRAPPQPEPPKERSAVATWSENLKRFVNEWKTRRKGNGNPDAYKPTCSDRLAIDELVRNTSDQAAVVEAATKELRGRVASLEHARKLDGIRLAELEAEQRGDHASHLSELDEMARARDLAYSQRDANAKAAGELAELREIAKRLLATGHNMRDDERYADLLHLDQPAPQPETVPLPPVGSFVGWIGAKKNVQVYSHWDGCVDSVTKATVHGFNCEGQVSFRLDEEGKTWQREPFPETVPLVENAVVTGDACHVRIDGYNYRLPFRCVQLARICARVLSETRVPKTTETKGPKP